jgi:modulator of FtsH protease
MYNMRPVPYEAQAQRAPITEVLPYLRKVYALFSGGIAFAVAGALVALYAGKPLEVPVEGGTIAVPPVVAFGLEHFWIMLFVFFGSFFAASAARRVPGVNVAALFGYTFINGLFIAPSIFIAMLMASQGATMDASPVRDAFLLTGAAFSGLTAYVFISQKDFSFLGASLWMGLLVVLGASFLGFFFHSAAFSLAIASVGVLLFCGYILYDTSRLLRAGENDPVGAALRLFLDVINLFLFLLQILSSRRR